MYIDLELLLSVGRVIGLLGTFAGAVAAACRVIDRDRKQSAKIQAIQAEQALICYGVLACLKGLREQGCDGPVSDALVHLEKHLNQAAHEAETS